MEKSGGLQAFRSALECLAQPSSGLELFRPFTYLRKPNSPNYEERDRVEEFDVKRSG